jgi:hypothetical protein
MQTDGEPTVQKVIACVTRGEQLLVFRHTKLPGKAPQLQGDQGTMLAIITS